MLQPILSSGPIQWQCQKCKMSVKEEKIETTSCEVLDEAFDFMKKAHELINQQALDVRKEKEAFDSVAKKLDHVHFASTIKVNVGGQYFTTSLQTLTKDKGSMLHAMFSGRFDTKPGEDGSYFIDRDGTHFRYILNYLRTGYLLVPDDKLIRKEILEEAEFYQIRGIVGELCPPPFLRSNILSDDQKQIFVNSWLKNRLDRRHSSFVLLYRASRDGWVASKFHAICDHRGPTVTVVRSGDYIFGGYTEESWDKGKLCMCRCSRTLTSITTPFGSGTHTSCTCKLSPAAFYTVFYSILVVITIVH